MIEYCYTSNEDGELIRKSFYNNAYIIFGKKKLDKIAKFKEFWNQEVSNINVFPQYYVSDIINHKTPGRCALDDKKEKLIIEMLGYNGASREKSSFIKHEGTHEFCHSFVDLLPKYKNNHVGGIIKNGIHCENHMGMIKESDPVTGNLVGQHYYGKMFNETMMDIISSIAINYFDSDNNSKSVNDILNKNYNDWENEKTGYSIFTSITRLAIAAFANIAPPDYDKAVKEGIGIFNIKNIKNGKEYYVNDFLYGIVFDPLHIEEEFDKYMGNGSYRSFCESLDRLFIKSLGKDKLPSDEVKRVMNIMPDFLNKKLNYYRNNDLMDLNTANQIIGNFNEIWYSMQIEYEAYFSKNDIAEIGRRAGRLV